MSRFPLRRSVAFSLAPVMGTVVACGLPLPPASGVGEAVTHPQPAARAVAESSEAAATWPQWRGPNRDGISPETGLDRDWPKDGPPLRWRRSDLGSGMGSLAFAGDRFCSIGEDRGAVSITCRGTEDGSEIWSTRIDGSGRPNATPTIDLEAGLVFGLSRDGELLCVDLQTGAEKWRKSFTRDFGGSMMSGWGYSESPLIDGDRLICTPGGSDALMVALDKRTGATVWQTKTGDLGERGKNGAGYSSAVVGEGGGTRQYVQLVGRGVVGVRAEDGALLWHYGRVANTTANIPTPVVDGDFVFCSSGYDDGGSALLKLSGSRSGVRAREVWYKDNRELQNHHGGVVLLDGKLYFGHGHNNGFPVCVDLRSGRDLWKRQRGAGAGSAAVIYADGDLYFRYQDGVLARIAADPSGYQLEAQFESPGDNAEHWSLPAIHDGRLYLRDQQDLYVHDLR